MNNTVQFKSCVVNASAGFGKTENLAVRFIGMLLAADNPLYDSGNDFYPGCGNGDI